MVLDNTESPTPNSILRHVTSIPQILYKDEQGNLSAHVAGNVNPSRGELVAGMAITNVSNPGTIAYATVPPRSIDCTGAPEQQLICTINSNHEDPSSRIFHFTKGSAGREHELHMRVTDYEKPDSLVATANKLNLIPMLVAPGSIAVSKNMTSDELKALGFDYTFGSEEELSGILKDLMKGVVRSVPILAEAGVKIYNELSSGGGQANQPRTAFAKGAAQPQFFPGIGAIASVAVPLVGSLIGKLLD